MSALPRSLAAAAVATMVAWSGIGAALAADRTASPTVVDASALVDRTWLGPSMSSTGDTGGEAPSIINGEDAEPGAYPFMASIQLHSATMNDFSTTWVQIPLPPETEDARGRHHCGATLIDPEWVITAAHCVSGSFGIGFAVVPYVAQPSDVQVLIGATDLVGDDGAPAGELLDVAEVVAHPRFPRNHFPAFAAGAPAEPEAGHQFDVALLRLATPSSIEPVVLGRERAFSPPGSDTTIIGWGQINGSGDMPVTLQQVTVPVHSDEVCEADAGLFTAGNICVGTGFDAEVQQAACHGDSGGPMLSRDGDHWIQTGVASFKVSNCWNYTAYWSVGSAASWIYCTSGVSVDTGLLLAWAPNCGRTLTTDLLQPAR